MLVDTRRMWRALGGIAGSRLALLHPRNRPRRRAGRKETHNAVPRTTHEGSRWSHWEDAHVPRERSPSVQGRRGGWEEVYGWGIGYLSWASVMVYEIDRPISWAFRTTTETSLGGSNLGYYYADTRNEMLLRLSTEDVGDRI